MNREIEINLYNEGYQYIVGLDEAGRGPLAGPVVVAAVVFAKDYENSVINDSKKVNEKNRILLFDQIINDAIEYSIIIKDNYFIDEHNIYHATKLAMLEAVNQIKKYDYILTDAMPLPLDNCQAIIKGDQKVLAIAAASILAKVTRDRIMVEYDKIYPNYQFAKHKGYPTKLHREMLAKLGATPIHRESFKPVADAKQATLFDYHEKVR